MKTIAFFISGANLVALALAQGSGSGPYPAAYSVDPSLPDHTVYMPEGAANVEGGMPVLVWGNGGCSSDSLSHQNLLLEVASYGIMAIAQGTPGGQGSTTAEQMTAAIDWIEKQAGSGTYANVDAKRVAAAGMSCGGIEAYGQVSDARVGAIGIFNSGQFDAAGTQSVVPGIKTPIFYFLGGSTDIAYANGERDYAAVSAGVPSWKGNDNSGHGGTYSQPNGGRYGTAAANYFRWVLRGETEGAAYFTGGGAKADGWNVESKSLDALKPLAAGLSNASAPASRISRVRRS